MILNIQGSHSAMAAVHGNPFLATAIMGRAKCPQHGMDFWVLHGKSGKAEDFLCRNGTTLYITGKQCHNEELAEFALTVGFSQLITDLNLPIPKKDTIAVLAWRENCPPLDNRVITCTADTQSFSLVDFAQLQRQCGVFEDDHEADRYAVSLSYALRREMAAAVAIRLGRQIAAGAAVNHIAHGHSIIGAVAVLPDYRRCGLGTAVVKAAVLQSLKMNARPMLCCRQELVSLYQGAGFVEISPIWQYRKEMTRE